MELVGPSDIPATGPSVKYLDILRNETGWIIKSVSKVSEKLSLIRIRTPNHPARRQSLYPLVIAAYLLKIHTAIGIVVNAKTIDTKRNYYS
jgi:hypothetical protein